MTSLASLTIHLVLPRGGDLTSNTKADIEGIPLEVLLDHTNLLDHSLFTRLFVTGDTNVVCIVVVDISGCSLDAFPTIVLLETREYPFPGVFANIRVEEGAVVFTETNFYLNFL